MRHAGRRQAGARPHGRQQVSPGALHPRGRGAAGGGRGGGGGRAAQAAVPAIQASVRQGASRPGHRDALTTHRKRGCGVNIVRAGESACAGRASTTAVSFSFIVMLASATGGTVQMDAPPPIAQQLQHVDVSSLWAFRAPTARPARPPAEQVLTNVVSPTADGQKLRLGQRRLGQRRLGPVEWFWRTRGRPCRLVGPSSHSRYQPLFAATGSGCRGRSTALCPGTRRSSIGAQRHVAHRRQGSDWQRLLSPLNWTDLLRVFLSNMTRPHASHQDPRPFSSA